MEGQWIVENSMMAQELIHRVKKYQSKDGLMLAKIDLKKAYDKMEWTFLDVALEA